jgi:hypothetical protein
VGRSHAVQVQRMLPGMHRCVAASWPRAPARMCDRGHLGREYATGRLPLAPSPPQQGLRQTGPAPDSRRIHGGARRRGWKPAGTAGAAGQTAAAAAITRCRGPFSPRLSPAWR